MTFAKNRAYGVPEFAGTEVNQHSGNLKGLMGYLQTFHKGLDGLITTTFTTHQSQMHQHHTSTTFTNTSPHHTSTTSPPHIHHNNTTITTSTTTTSHHHNPSSHLKTEQQCVEVLLIPPHSSVEVLLNFLHMANNIINMSSSILLIKYISEQYFLNYHTNNCIKLNLT